MKGGLTRALGRGVGRLLSRDVRVRVSAARASALSYRTSRRLRRMAATGRPIVAGPWFGEVGFELLYWIPFLSWFAETCHVGPERIVAVSRGGARSWYANLASRYCDVFEVIDPAEYRERNAARIAELGEQKQIAVTAFDDEVAAAVRSRVGADAEVLHPSLMYALFAPFWWGHLPLDWVDAHARFRRMPCPPLPPGLVLPAEYAAVKFYFNDCFLDANGTRAFVQETVRGLAHRGPVVSLSTGLAIDEHAACDAEALPALIQPGYDARTNLDVQTAIVGRARTFVGTYGGFAYLSPFLGVPAVSYFSDPHGYSPRHLEVAQLAMRRMGNAGALELHDVHARGAAATAGGTVCSSR